MTDVQEAPVPEAPARRAARIVVHDADGRLADAVRAALAGRDPEPEVVECRRARALGDLLSGEPVNVLVAATGPDADAGLERLRIIREEVPATGLVLVADGTDDLDPAALVRTGAVELVTRPELERALLPALDRALRIDERLHAVAPAAAGSADRHPPTAGRVVTIASASGGGGKTFVATNLAWFLHHHGGLRTCLVDLDLQFGEVASSLRIKPRFTVADLVQQSDGDLSAHLPEVCEQHETGIWVLPAPADPAEAQLVGPADVARVVEAARDHFDAVVVDTPPALSDTVISAFDRSDELLVLATLDVPSIRNLHVFLTTLERLEVPRDVVRLVMNKAEDDVSVDVGRILRLFPAGFDATLPYAREVHRAVNAGRLVLDSAPEAEISRRLGALLRRFLPPEAEAGFDASRPPARRRLLRRGR